MIPIALTTAESLESEIVEFLLAQNHYLDKSSFTILKFLKSCKELANTDAIAASIIISQIYSFCGELKKSIYYADNAQRLGYKGTCERRAASYINMGYITKAFEQSELSLANRGAGQFDLTMKIAFGSCAFHAIVSAVNAANERNEVLIMSNKIYHLSIAAKNVLDQLGHSADAMAKLCDAAGELLRERKLLWKHETPTMRVSAPEMGEPNIFCSYYVDVSPEEAAEMNWQLMEKLVTNDLLADGLMVDFVGDKVAA